METSAAELILKSIQDLKTLGITLGVLIIANIGAIGIKYYFDQRLKNADVKINKASLINSRLVSVQEELFHKLDNLTKIDVNDSATIVTEVQEAFRYMNKFQLFIPKKLRKTSHDLLDYFTSVGLNPSNKKYETETALLDNYTNEFLK
ncbi:hypothetical protein [Pontibacter populi]|uniref:Uncharacterized protein n=1 Tax=Pontibacter populi TaxID=890055 RepID=A0ABV1RQ08_9BACT